MIGALDLLSRVTGWFLEGINGKDMEWLKEGGGFWSRRDVSFTASVSPSGQKTSSDSVIRVGFSNKED